MIVIVSSFNKAAYLLLLSFFNLILLYCNKLFDVYDRIYINDLFI